MHRTFQHSESQPEGMKLPAEWQFTSPCAITQVPGIFSNTNLTKKFWRVTKYNGIRLYCLGVTCTSLVNNSKGNNPFLALDFIYHPVVSSRALPPHYIATPFRHLICVHAYTLGNFFSIRFLPDTLHILSIHYSSLYSLSTYSFN